MNQQNQLTSRQNVIHTMSNLADEIFVGCQTNSFEEIVIRETVDYFLRVGSQFSFHEHDIKLKIAVCKRFIDVNPDSSDVSGMIAQIAEYETELVMIKDLLEKVNTYAMRLTAKPQIH